MQTHGQLEQRIDELVQGVLVAAREVALAAVAEAFAQSEKSRMVPGADRQSGDAGRAARTPVRAHGRRRRSCGKKRSPEELDALGAKLYEAIDAQPGETMNLYAKEVGSTPGKLSVPVRRLVEEGRVRMVGDRNQRRYYPGTAE